MELLKKKYIIDESNRKVAVQLDIKTFEKIEKIMENFALFHLMRENDDDEALELNDAKEYYAKLEKAE